MSVVQIRHHLESILSYMQPYWLLVNSHMVNYLTHNHWERFVPPLLRAEVADGKQKVNQCIEAMFWFRNKKHLNTKDFPEFGEFLKESEKYRLANFEDVIFTPDELRNLYGIMSHDPNAKISIKEFIKEKKRHEVELVAELVNDIIRLLRSKDENVEMIVVDAGDGIGYLSSRLTLQYNQKVLGIDFNEDNTKNAIERHRKLQRAWKSLTERAALEKLGINTARRRKEIKEDKQHCFNARVDSSLHNYKTTSKFIT